MTQPRRSNRAAVQQQLVQQEADGPRRLNLDREQVLTRLWEIANLSPEMTRGSITGQVKALSMIVAMQNFIPDPPAVSSEKKSVPPPVRSETYAAASPSSEEEAPPNPGTSHSSFASRFIPRRPRHWRLISPRSLLFQTREWDSL